MSVALKTVLWGFPSAIVLSPVWSPGRTGGWMDGRNEALSTTLPSSLLLTPSHGLEKNQIFSSNLNVLFKENFCNFRIDFLLIEKKEK